MRVRKAKKAPEDHKPKRQKQPGAHAREAIGARKPSGPLMKSPKTQARINEKRTRISRLVVQGYSTADIADLYGWTIPEAAREIDAAIQSDTADAEEWARRARLKIEAKLDALDRAWMVDATGGIRQVNDEQVVIMKTESATRLIQRNIRERTALLRAAMGTKVEVTGPVVVKAAGEPNEDEADRLWRTHFGSAVLPKVEAAEENEGKEPDDDGPVH